VHSVISAARKLAGRGLRYFQARVVFAQRARQLDFSPILSPWSRLRRDSTEVGRLRRLAIATLWLYVTSLPDRLVLLALACAWPARTWVRAARLAWHEGPFVKAESGVPLMRQWRSSVLAAGRFNYSPSAYYQYRFFEGHAPLGAYVQEVEMVLLHMRDRGESTTQVLLNKVVFFDECTRLGLPTPPLVAVFARGEDERWTAGGFGVFPRRALFLKDAAGQQGRGAERWLYEPDADRWLRRDVRNTHDEMLAHCRALGHKGAVIVQPVVENHPRIQEYSRETLCTLRVMSYFDSTADMRPVLIRAVFKIGRGGAEVDNLHAGGLACAVDATTGTLGVARGVWPSKGTHTHHPETGAAIRGTTLPFFHAAVELALRAHERLAGLPWSVGWDVAISADGPLLLEGNSHWGADLAQAPRPEPFDATFATRLLARLSAMKERGAR
jgi:hypothetical protein